MKVKEQDYAQLSDGTKIKMFTVSNSKGIEARVIDYGGILVSLKTPDRRAQTINVTLGFDKFEDYVEKSPFFGAVVGRYANRITSGKFILDEKEYTLACNDTYGAGPDAVANHLHGGEKGYDKVLWKAEPFQESSLAGVRLHYLSRDGEEGYPGNLDITMTYQLNEDDELSFEYQANTDKPTPVNLTQHSYWNLTGTGTILDHQVTLFCPFYIPVGKTLMPTGEVLSVNGTPFDFTVPRAVGEHIGDVEGGYDHCFVAGPASTALKRIADIYEPNSGRGMEIWTTKPGIQFYSGNFLDNLKGAGGAIYPKHGGFCVETEFFPDSVNIPHFPSCILRPGQTYSHKTTHRFYTR
ncbi:MAG: galactose mutarotase [Spirochaetaceae bacterium]|nr:MAG: galactose mutarotase [Spirochaetaceae bacterium]